MIDAERILVVAPHPDDEVVGCGGTLALAAARGAVIHVVVVFDGALGDPARRYPDQDYPERRQREALRAGAHLGVERYTFWGLPEGHLATDAELDAGAARLAELVAEFAPDVILTPWDEDDHVDHRTVARAVERLVDQHAFRGEVWGFEVWSHLAPEQLVDVSSVWTAKLAALRAHESQLAYGDLEGQMTALASRLGAGLLEGFARLGEAA